MGTRLYHLPELYFIVLIFISGFRSQGGFSLLYLIPMAVLVFQIWRRSQMLDIILSMFLVLVHVYFLMALLSEAHEMSAAQMDSRKILFTGLAVWVSNMLVMGIWVYRAFAVRAS